MSSSRWIGKSIGGRYQIEALLGQGGMSAVYKATDPNLKRTVAVKLIHSQYAGDPEFIRRFREEASVVAQLRHRNIVQVFDFNQDGDEFYMVMEFLAGETLRARLDRLNRASSRMPLAEVLKYAINVCDAADYAHRRSLIHRDIKPANVLLDTEGQAILMDFGIAKIIGGPQYTATGATIGTAVYMPPEQIRGEQVDRRSDVYSTGVMLYEMVAGHPPFQAASAMTVLMMHINDPVPDVSQIRPDCPAELRAAIERAMAKEPDNRFQSAAGMSAALGQALRALQKSQQAPTRAGPVAVQATDVARTAQAKQALSSAGSRAGKAAGSEATALPKSQAMERAAASTAPHKTPRGEDRLPEVTSGSSGRSNAKLLITCGLLLFAAVLLAGGVFLTVFILNQKGGEEGTAVVEVEATQAATAVVAETATPTLAPSPSPTPGLSQTEVPEEAAASPTGTPEPGPIPAPSPVGLLEFIDNSQARAGSLHLTISEAGSPASNSHYELWLSDGETLTSMGALASDGAINSTVDGNVNLIATYSSALITAEPDDRQSEGPVGETIFVGTIPLASLEQIRLLVASAPETPGQVAYLVGADEQNFLAMQHSGFLADALAAGDLTTAKQHAEHVINILAGEGHPAFGDWTGDGVAQNPGDGFGVAAYLQNAVEHAQLATEADGVTEEVIVHTFDTIDGANNALASTDEAIQAAGRVLAADSVAEAQPSAELLAEALQRLINGEDQNGDGVIDPTTGEAGLLLAYEHAVKAASFEFFRVGDVAGAAGEG